MDKPKLEMFRVQKNGKPAIEMVVRNATKEMRPVLDALGVLPTPDMANRRGIVCATPDELEAVRAPILHFFDKQ